VSGFNVRWGVAAAASFAFLGSGRGGLRWMCGSRVKLERGGGVYGLERCE